MAMPKSRWIHSVYAVGVEVFVTVSPSPSAQERNDVPLSSLTRQELRRAAANLRLAMDRDATVERLTDEIVRTVAGGNGVGRQPSAAAVAARVTAAAPSVPSSLDLGIISEVIRNEVATAVAATPSSVDEDRVSDMIAEAINKVSVPVTVQYTRPSGTTVTIQGAHRSFATVLNRVQAGLTPWLHGEAGTGKTTLAIQMAEALGVPFYGISVTAQMTAAQFFGYTDARGETVRTPFRECFENGGVFLFDEASSAQPNLSAGVNMALANGVVQFPDGMVERHSDCYFMAAANDVGLGPTPKYPKGLKQDASFLDRFTFCELVLDEAVVAAGVASRCDDSATADRWLDVWRRCRTNVQTYGLNVTITPRSAFDGAVLLSIGESLTDAARDCILKGLAADQAAKVLEGTGITI
jgi:hypothetical protein